MSKVGFFAPCPEGHVRPFEYDSDELDAVLRDGALVLRCENCDIAWRPSDEELANLREHADAMRNVPDSQRIRVNIRKKR